MSSFDILSLNYDSVRYSINQRLSWVGGGVGGGSAALRQPRVHSFSALQVHTMCTELACRNNLCCLTEIQSSCSRILQLLQVFFLTRWLKEKLWNISKLLHNFYFHVLIMPAYVTWQKKNKWKYIKAKNKTKNCPKWQSWKSAICKPVLGSGHSIRTQP